MPLRFFPHPFSAQKFDQLFPWDMVLRTDAHGVKCSVRDPVKERFIAVSGQGGGLQDGQVVRHIYELLDKESDIRRFEMYRSKH